MQVYHAPVPVEEQDVNRETHADRVDGFFTTQEQPLARSKGAMTQETPQSRPHAGGDDSLVHKDGLASPVEGAHSDAQPPVVKDDDRRAQ